MKVRLNITTDRHDMQDHTLYVNDKHVESIGTLSECPEDACIGRSLIDGDDIIKYMRLAYEAGKAGEPLDITYTENEDE